MTLQHIPTAFGLGEIVTVCLEQMRVRCAHTPADSLDRDMTIPAVPTWYAGVTFRSRLEADWAATLDTLDIAWEYEPETITLPSGNAYTPDFWLPELGTWVEVKGPGVPGVDKAHELAATRTCRCRDRCGCGWPGGELVLIAHPPQPADLATFLDDTDPPHWVAQQYQRRHGGHPTWSTAHGPRALLSRCRDCTRAGWFILQAPVCCRACRGPLAGVPAHPAGDGALEFVHADGRPAPTRRLRTTDRTITVLPSPQGTDNGLGSSQR